MASGNTKTAFSRKRKFNNTAKTKNSCFATYPSPIRGPNKGMNYKSFREKHAINHSNFTKNIPENAPQNWVVKIKPKLINTTKPASKDQTQNGI